MREHRTAASMGIQTFASRRGGKAWLKKVRKSLWFRRLMPLHSPLLTEVALDLGKEIRAKREANAGSAKPRAVPRCSLRAPRRGDLDTLVTEAKWRAIEPGLRLGGASRLRARESFTAIVVVAVSGIPWAELPKGLGLGTGQNALRTLRKWQAAGLGGILEAGILRCAPGADLSRLRQPHGPRKTRRGRQPKSHPVSGATSGLRRDDDYSGA